MVHNVTMFFRINEKTAAAAEKLAEAAGMSASEWLRDLVRKEVARADGGGDAALRDITSDYGDPISLSGVRAVTWGCSTTSEKV